MSPHVARRGEPAQPVRDGPGGGVWQRLAFRGPYGRLTVPDALDNAVVEEGARGLTPAGQQGVFGHGRLGGARAAVSRPFLVVWSAVDDRAKPAPARRARRMPTRVARASATPSKDGRYRLDSIRNPWGTDGAGRAFKGVG